MEDLEEFLEYEYYRDICDSVEVLIEHKYPLLYNIYISPVDIGNMTGFTVDFDNKSQYPEIEEEARELINKLIGVTEV